MKISDFQSPARWARAKTGRIGATYRAVRRERAKLSYRLTKRQSRKDLNK